MKKNTLTISIMLLTLNTMSLFALKALPAPYNSVDLLPYDSHGFFGKSNRRMLHQFIAEHNPKIVVEVGVWLGSSAISMAEKLGSESKLYAIDHFKGSLEHSNPSHPQHNKVRKLYQQFLSNVIHKKMTEVIIPVRMSSLDAATALNIKPNLIYIDGSHEEEDVLADILAWHKKLAPKGIICGDDWMWGAPRGYPVRRAVQRAAKILNQTIASVDNFWYFK